MQTVFESTISILEQYKLYFEWAFESATGDSVADSEFVLKSSNKLATGILNDCEHCRTVQTFLKQPGVYLNSTNYI